MTNDAVSSQGLTDEARALIAKSFFKIRFRGGRFEGGDGGMPLAAARELTYLDELIHEVAKVLWRRARGKQRLPPSDYPAEPILRVKEFGAGSSIPLIVRDGESSLLHGDPYEASRDLVEKTFWSIIDESEIPDDFPAECYDLLKRVGKSLDAGESHDYVEITADGTTKSHQLTQKSRKNFWDDFNSRTRKNVLLVGSIEALARPGSFTFKNANGMKLDGKSELYDDMYAALGKFDAHPICRLSAEVEVDYLDRIRKITSVEKVEVFEMMPKLWMEQFLDLASRPSDWLPGALEIPTHILERTGALVQAAHDKNLPAPCIFGSMDGGTNLVWNFDEGRVTVYVDDDSDYEVELVPSGPVLPYEFSDPTETISKVSEFLIV